MKNSVLAAFLVSLAIGLGACAAQHRNDAPLPPITYHEQRNIDENEFWPDPQLKEIFGRYWRLCFDGRSKETWALEVTYFREMIPEQRYSGYIRGYLISELLGIEIWDLVKESDNFFTIRCAISFKKGNEKKELFFDDHWVKVRGEWYHVIRNPVLFPAAL